MITYLRKRNKHYDDMGELLCLMPTPDISLRRALICDDLGIDDKRLSNITQRARAAGCNLIADRKTRSLRVAPDSWERCKQLASDYWARVYN